MISRVLSWFQEERTNINVVADIATTFHEDINALEIESDQTLVEFEINTQYTIFDEGVVQCHLPKKKHKSTFGNNP
jgi:hypothetical protein